MHRLIDDLSINVTEMFRDPSFWKEFRENVIPFLQTFPSIRIWHAGCATGEEV
ncbi:protein-glutamate O-methyltransferase CheR, partial [Butyricicoccus sp. 1XD8-22]